MEALENIRAEVGTTVVIVTHDANLARHANRVLTLVDGALVNGVLQSNSA
jgi:putative ABC transport system ATP-binding protein